MIEGRVFQRFAARGSAWAASLAAAMRPHLFGLGPAPLALAGLAPRSLFKAEPERPLPALLAEAIGVAAAYVATDLAAVRRDRALGDERLAGLEVGQLHGRSRWCFTAASWFWKFVSPANANAQSAAPARCSKTTQRPPA